MQVIHNCEKNSAWDVHLINNFAIGRSSVSSIIPKETTAIQVCEKLIPKIKNKIISHSFRIPTSVVSCAEINLNLKKYSRYIIKDLHEWVKNHKYLELSKEICTSKDFEKKSASFLTAFFQHVLLRSTV